MSPETWSVILCIPRIGACRLHSMTDVIPEGARDYATQYVSCAAIGVWGFCPKLWWELTNALLLGVSPWIGACKIFMIERRL